MTDDRSTPFWAKCRSCAHCWEAAYYPSDMRKLCRILARAACPKCGEPKPMIAKQDNGKLLEQSHD